MPSVTDSNQGIILDAVSWTFFVISFTVCCTRLYADFLILRSPRLDTYVASFTFATIFTSQVFTTLSVHYGMGQHIDSLDPVQLMYSLKWSWIAQILQLFAITTGKIAVIVYLTTIHGPSHAKVKLACLGTLGLLQVASVTILIAFILAQCSSVQKLWNAADPGTCNGRVRNEYFAFFQVGLSAVTDVCLAVYPMVIFWNLQMKTKKKVLLCVLFGFGLLAAVCSIVRTCNLRRLGGNPDITYSQAYLITWTAVDMYVVFIAGSIPTSYPLFKGRVSKPARSHYSLYDRRSAPLDGDDGTTLTSFPVPPGRTKAYASATGRKMASQMADDDITEEGWTGDGQILMTTNVDITRDGESLKISP